MKITVITLFPDMFAGFLHESMIQKAQDQGLVTIQYVNPRDFTTDAHSTLDDRPYGGGAGMVLMVEPMKKAITASRADNSHVIMTSPRGSVFSQSKAQELSKLEDLVIVTGHYEGVDERIMSEIDEEISIGDYVLTGGELPAGVMIDSIVRLLPGVLKKEEASQDESFFEVPLAEVEKAVGATPEVIEMKGRGVKAVRLLEYPHYTRPQEFEGMKVPDVLLSGNHAEINRWHIKMAYSITLERRPDLFIKSS